MGLLFLSAKKIFFSLSFFLCTFHFVIKRKNDYNKNTCTQPGRRCYKRKFKIQLNRTLRGIRKVRILNFQAPNTSYNVHEKNNVLKFQTEDMTVHALAIETGNYSFVELLNEIMRVFEYTSLTFFYIVKKNTNCWPLLTNPFDSLLLRTVLIQSLGLQWKT